MMTNFVNLIIGVIGGVMASGLVIAFLWRMKPKIELSNNIAINDQGNSYTFKIKNNSKYNLHSVIFEIHRLCKNGGEISPVVLIDRHEQLNFFGKTKKEDGELCWKTKNNIFCKKKCDVLLVIKATHPISNFSNVFEKKYIYADVKKGLFKEKSMMVDISSK